MCISSMPGSGRRGCLNQQRHQGAFGDEIDELRGLAHRAEHRKHQDLCPEVEIGVDLAPKAGMNRVDADEEPGVLQDFGNRSQFTAVVVGDPGVEAHLAICFPEPLHVQPDPVDARDVGPPGELHIVGEQREREIASIAHDSTPSEGPRSRS
jgi:hypothetical protein